MRILIIGDVHGKLKYTKHIIKLNKDVNHCVLLGDIGFKDHYDILFEWYKEDIDSGKIILVPGNHDYFPYIEEKDMSGSGVFKSGDNEIPYMWIGGANSIDKQYRTEGIDWFREEQVSYKEANRIIEKYKEVRPQIVFSHTAPDSLVKKLYGYKDVTITKSMLEECFKSHYPNNWYYGHFHLSSVSQIGLTTFQCLRELEYVILEL